MQLPLFLLDAFTDTLFHGNPAAVVLLPRWLPEAHLQAIACENNQPSTAFLVAQNEGYAIRWLTPEIELDLCGHATLAAAHVLFNYFHPELSVISLFNKHGSLLQVHRQQDFITLAFPIKDITEMPIPPAITESLGIVPLAMYQHHAERCLIVLDSEASVRNLKPDMQPLKSLNFRGFIVTALGTQVDFVSRTFYPHKATPEDMVTGASHCLLVPYWAKKLGKTRLTAHQASSRGGDLRCELTQNQVMLSGQAVLYLRGTVDIPE